MCGRRGGAGGEREGKKQKKGGGGGGGGEKREKIRDGKEMRPPEGLDPEVHTRRSMPYPLGHR